MNCMTNKKHEESRKMTLKDYYDSLPKASCPKSDFIMSVANECGVTYNTVCNWIRGAYQPTKEHYVEVLSKHTGIPKEELWKR